MKYFMKLPELNCLTPDEYSTFKKIVEEVSECNQAIEELVLFEKQSTVKNWLSMSDEELNDIRNKYRQLLFCVLGEVMDIAQTCVSQLFVFEKKEINVEKYFGIFSGNESKDIFYTKNNCRYIRLEKTLNNDNLHTILNKVILSMGTIAQLEKFIGSNGEKKILNENEFLEKYILELFNIIQNCFNILYSMEEKYSIDLELLFEQHVDKLIEKGYYTN